MRPQATRGVNARRQGVADVPGQNLGLTVQFGGFEQRLEPQRRLVLESSQTVTHEDAIFLKERHDVGHRPERCQDNGVEQELAQHHTRRSTYD